MKVLDLFSGIGGFSLGLGWAGFETVAFCEIEPYAQNVLKKHWPSLPIHEDVKKLNGNDYKGIDIITGGFPCQDISNAGTKEGIKGERSGLWFELCRIISEARPRYAIMENVSALLHRGLSTVLSDLAKIGYDCQWHCIPASYVGAYHQRDRIWIIAYPHSDPNGKQLEYEKKWRDSERKIQERANSNSTRQLQPQRLNEELRRWIAHVHKENVSNSHSERLQRGENTREISGEGKEANEQFARLHSFKRGVWATEPKLARMVHGIPRRVDRTKGLGNAVVPQIPYAIGMAIKSTEEGIN